MKNGGMDEGRGRPVVVVMGVTGSGKTTVGRLLADRLGVEYADGDAFHPPENVAKMAYGLPLDDEDRRPWLEALGEWIGERSRAGRGGVVSCSALRRRYRDTLRQADPRLWFVHLDADRETIIHRVSTRHGHFMPVALVESQFRALEPLLPDEPGIVVDASLPLTEIVDTALSLLHT